jgi:NAD-dependent deacetylase
MFKNKPDFLKAFNKRENEDIKQLSSEWKPRLTFFTGSGISAESGIQTFRGNNGRWNDYDVSKICSTWALKHNLEELLEFYNQRRNEVLNTTPNKAHLIIKQLEKYFDVGVVTQNVDDLHERAGSKNVIHLHGQIMKSQAIANHEKIHDCFTDIKLGDRCPITNSQLRPHIVLFGENINNYYEARKMLRESHIIIVIGTSLQVTPASLLVTDPLFSKNIYLIDPIMPPINSQNKFIHIPNVATSGLKSLESDFKRLLKYFKDDFNSKKGITIS